MAISDVEKVDPWIIVYDNSGKKKRMGGNNKDVVGVTADFFVTLQGSWIVTYDKYCKEQSRRGA